MFQFRNGAVQFCLGAFARSDVANLPVASFKPVNASNRSLTARQTKSDGAPLL